MMRDLLSRIARFARPAAVFSAAAALLVLVCAVAPLPLQLGYLGILLAAAVALLIEQQANKAPAHPDVFEDPLVLARDEMAFNLYRQTTEALKAISFNNDPIYRNLALQRTKVLAEELGDVAEGQLVFVGTETWRMAYAQLLRSPGLHLYRSIAYVKTATYWQDQPGRHSMQVNLQMVGKGALNIERIAVIPDHLWLAGERFPIEPIHGWIDEQHRNGIRVKLVRQSALAKEFDLVVDLGIYGMRAVGVQELDEQGRTVRFTLTFDFAEVLAAEQRWERLSVYATPYRDLLEQAIGV